MAPQGEHIRRVAGLCSPEGSDHGSACGEARRAHRGLASLDGALEALARGRAAVVEVAGEPGIGKTTLLEELAARAGARGCLVLTGSAAEIEGEVPFGVFVDALDEYVQGIPEHRLADLDDNARAQLAAGDAGAAAERALASAQAAGDLGAPLESAHARALAGRALAAAGESERATVELTRAAAAFDGAGIDSLTERERQIAELVVDRKTNPQIAAELFLSQKTVESHLRNLFYKLGVSSRVEVARIVERSRRDG